MNPASGHAGSTGLPLASKVENCVAMLNVVQRAKDRPPVLLHTILFQPLQVADPHDDRSKRMGVNVFLDAIELRRINLVYQ